MPSSGIKQSRAYYGVCGSAVLLKKNYCTLKFIARKFPAKNYFSTENAVGYFINGQSRSNNLPLVKFNCYNMQ